MISKLKVITKTPYDRESESSQQVTPVLQGPSSVTSDFEVIERVPAAIKRPQNHDLNFEKPSLSEEPLPSRIDQARRLSETREQELISLWESMSNRETLLASTPTIKPANGYYSSPFGYRIDPINGRALLHAGVDIAAPYGSPVRAPAEGLVSYVGHESGYGNLVSIDHGFGVVTRFAHNSRILVKEGQRVHRGDAISLVGSTGHSTGAHVHYEVRVNGLPVDPTNYILQEN